jgi:GTP-binding protein
MRVEKVEFVQSAAKIEQAPKENLPEIAFLGPSNVGKSSLINAITGRKGLARVSKTPGRTQLLNFFKVNESVWFVDLPGYGFAKVPKKVQGAFLKMVEDYLSRSERLQLLLLLLDCRRDPSARDAELQAWLVENDIPHVIVLTKADKLSRSQLQRRKREMEKSLGMAELGAQALPFSATTGIGRKELMAVIDEALAPGD